MGKNKGRRQNFRTLDPTAETLTRPAEVVSEPPAPPLSLYKQLQSNLKFLLYFSEYFSSSFAATKWRKLSHPILEELDKGTLNCEAFQLYLYELRKDLREKRNLYEELLTNDLWDGLYKSFEAVNDSPNFEIVMRASDNLSKMCDPIDFRLLRTQLTAPISNKLMPKRWGDIYGSLSFGIINLLKDRCFPKNLPNLLSAIQSNNCLPLSKPLLSEHLSCLNQNLRGGQLDAFQRENIYNILDSIQNAYIVLALSSRVPKNKKSMIKRHIQNLATLKADIEKNRWTGHANEARQSQHVLADISQRETVLDDTLERLELLRSFIFDQEKINNRASATLSTHTKKTPKDIRRITKEIENSSQRIAVLHLVIQVLNETRSCAQDDKTALQQELEACNAAENTAPPIEPSNRLDPKMRAERSTSPVTHLPVIKKLAVETEKKCESSEATDKLDASPRDVIDPSVLGIFGAIGPPKAHKQTPPARDQRDSGWKPWGRPCDNSSSDLVTTCAPV